MRRKVEFTNKQAKIITIIIISLSIVVLIESVYILYLKFQRLNTHVEIVEVPPVVLKVQDEDQEKTVNTDLKKNEHITEYEFDYKKAVVESVDFLESASDVSIYTISAENMEKAIGGCGSPYIITEISTGVYSFVTFKECEIISKIPQKTLYGIVLLSTRSQPYAAAKMLSLRNMGHPSFVYHFKKDGEDYYSTVLGAFPSRDVGKNYYKRLNIETLMNELNIRERGYVACLINCGD